MNYIPIFLVVFSFALATDANALTLNVKQNNKVVNKGKTNDTKTQTRSLDITMTSLENGTVDAEARWWIFAKDMKTGKETTFKRGTNKATLEKNVASTVQSDTITSTYTEEHTEIEKSKGNKNGGGKKGDKTTAKKIPASGDRITGYAVQVLIGKELVADYYSAPSYKDMIRERGR